MENGTGGEDRQETRYLSIYLPALECLCNHQHLTRNNVLHNCRHSASWLHFWAAAAKMRSRRGEISSDELLVRTPVDRSGECPVLRIKSLHVGASSPLLDIGITARFRNLRNVEGAMEWQKAGGRRLAMPYEEDLPRVQMSLMSGGQVGCRPETLS
jgi:hypothetical protein